MHQDVEAVPVVVQVFEHLLDLAVVLHVTGHQDVGVEVRNQFLDSIAKALVLVSEGEFRTLAMHGCGDAIGNGAVAGNADDQCALALQKTHVKLSLAQVRADAPRPGHLDGARPAAEPWSDAVVSGSYRCAASATSVP